jgi:hypothetical protein
MPVRFSREELSQRRARAVAAMTLGETVEVKARGCARLSKAPLQLVVK